MQNRKTSYSVLTAPNKDIREDSLAAPWGKYEFGVSLLSIRPSGQLLTKVPRGQRDAGSHHRSDMTTRSVLGGGRSLLRLIINYHDYSNLP